MQIILLKELGIAFILIAFLLAIMFRWQIKPEIGLYANIRTLLQLLMVGYSRTYVFDISEPIVIVQLAALIIVVSTWGERRSFDGYITKPYLIILI